MIAQQELQNLLALPDQEKLRLAHRLLESLINGQNGQHTHEAAQSQPVEEATTPATEVADEPHPSVKWLLSMAGMYSGGPVDTGARADEICQAEIKRRSGFTLKEELP